MIEQGTLLNFVGGHVGARERLGLRPDLQPGHGPGHRQGAALGRGDGGQGRGRRARRAYQTWRRVPPGDRIQPLFKLKALLDAALRRSSRGSSPRNAARRSVEAEGELQRGIENVEVATGIPSLMMGRNLEDIASGIDEMMIRQPVGRRRRPSRRSTSRR